MEAKLDEKDNVVIIMTMKEAKEVLDKTKGKFVAKNNAMFLFQEELLKLSESLGGLG